ncbi:MAG TPA: biotin carboxylase N-terminal domain-containing protein [Xanthobacteraceae bacterium]|nr:biotin carboxylase N-terminal domain-containing protein [Xanthobacteraceae bacterium]
MFPSVLIANRGEIAVRVIRTARALGLRTIAVYSEADREALHVRLADEAHLIGPAAARDSYLDIGRIMDVGRRTKAAALHPGYGFLAERPELAEACAVLGIVFVGPPATAMRQMGAKGAAKALMAKAGVPLLPGYHGDKQDAAFLRQKAYETGYPVLIKAVAGGGGKGMRRVDKAIEFDDALASAQREAQSAFGDGRVLIEKYVARARHIEVQIFADNFGNVVHLFERDCSLQRRHQKVIEESPAPGMSGEVRKRMTEAAVTAARTVGYRGAGTVEFLVDAQGGLRPDGFWFLEMNTRLQVEHPVTELVTGLDLVEWQFRVAAGEKLPRPQEAIRLKGHAVEARLYAEDPEHDFLPSSGRLAVLRFPEGEGIRVDAGVEEGGEVTPFYDPMIAKIIAYDSTRARALARLGEALAATVAAGPRNNVAFLRALVAAKEVLDGNVDTGLIERSMEKLGAVAQPPDHAAAARAVEALVKREQTRLAARARKRSNEKLSPWDASDAFAFSAIRETSLTVSVDGVRARARVRYGADPRATVEGAEAAECLLVETGESLIALRDGRQTVVAFVDGDAVDAEQADAGGLVTAPMHGKVLTIEVAEGEAVKKGQRLLVLEAMKMEHALTAPAAGTVAEIAVKAGDQVAERAKLMVIKPTAPVDA